MDCNEARTQWLDRRRGSLGGDAREALESHLAGCEACRRDEAADRELSSVLDSRLPRRRAPEALRRSLEARWGDAPARPPQRPRRVARTLLAMAAGAAIALFAVVGWRARSSDDTMLAEAVNDHLRVLYSERPIEVEPGIHQVKPWFEGRLDFAPAVAFAGDDDFPLQGGAVAYFMDRKAATFVFKRRLHVITLFVFRAEGLPWAAVASEPVGAARGTLGTSRGYHVLMWRKDDLGYALVSDVDVRDLSALGAKIAGGP
jgi:anti-sigma factor RsiW